MASGSGSSFSKDQLALAKQLQSGYMTSGTFHSQGQGGPSKGAPSQQAPRKPAQPVRSQPPAPRSMNGLVRPLPSNGTYIIHASLMDQLLTAPSTSYPAGRHELCCGPKDAAGCQTCPCRSVCSWYPACSPQSHYAVGCQACPGSCSASQCPHHTSSCQISHSACSRLGPSCAAHAI